MTNSELNNLRIQTRTCCNCGNSYNYKNLGNTTFKKDFDRNLKYCPSCKRIIPCKICGTLFYNKSGQQTCSSDCAKKLKEKSYQLSCGSSHNFSKTSKSRIKWEEKLIETENITNVFQRNDTKEKIKNTFLNKYGVEYVSQIPEIKIKKIEKFKTNLENDPNYANKIYIKSRNTCIKKYGYDPRINFSGSSKEALNIFSILNDYLINELKLEETDIYFADKKNNKKEYWLSSDDKFRLFDFTIKSKKIIIEYNGSAWHPDYRDDKKLLEWRHPFSKDNYINYLNDFNSKIELAKNNGFDVLVIWDTESIEDNLIKCKDFINKKI